MKRIISLTAPLLLIAACNKEMTPPESGAVAFRLSIAENAAACAAATRAADAEQLLATATVKIYNGDFSGLVRSYNYADMPEAVYLPAETYRIDIEAGEATKESPAAASFDAKSYKGSENFTVTAGETSSVQVTASVSNAITVANFDPSVGQTFSDFTFTIGLSDSDPAQQLVYTAANAGSEGYFIPSGFEPSLYWTFRGTPVKGGGDFVKSGEIPDIEGGKRYTMTLRYSKTEGGLTFTLAVDTSTEDHDDQIVFEPVSTGLSASSVYEIWAAHATVHADVDETEYGTEGIFFEHRRAGTEDEWIRTAAVRDSEGMYSARLASLSPQTEYEYRLLVPDPSTQEPTPTGDAMTFTTEAAPALPNAGFEDTSNAESSKYTSFFNPDSQVAANRTKWWCTGNKGSTSVGSSYSIADSDASDFKEGTRSIRLHSEWVILKFAAGNVFSGSFGDVQGTTGGTVYFGRPFTGRPTALRLWVKYSTGTVNRIDKYPDNDPVTSSDYDRGLVRVVLGDWDYREYGGTSESPVLVNTTQPEKFIDYPNDKATIAFGEEIIRGDAANSTNVWKQITIPLDYKDTDRRPTHIIVSCAASMLGDYFTGCDRSEMWLDGMELLYE